jgi:hypothetical protein
LNPDYSLPGWKPKTKPDLINRMLLQAVEVSRTHPKVAELLLEGSDKLVEMNQRLDQADEIIGRFAHIYAGR